ncbi:MAG: DUF6142 family protein [Lachnospiraceae bacterium]|nr:DUF6142 family protein [Lachnospiraceae bacterium]
MRRKKGFRKYKFTEKTLSKQGLTAFVLAALSIFSCVLMVSGSSRSGGNLGVYIASTGILAWIVAVVALVLAIRSLKEENSFRTFPYLGTVFSGLAVLMWTAIYVRGLL